MKHTIKVLAFGILIGCQPASEKQVDQPTKDYGLTPVPFSEVTLEDQFWKPRLKTQMETLVPFTFEKTLDRVNMLQMAANRNKGIPYQVPPPDRYGTSDLYKIIEGATYLMMDNPDPAIEERIDGIIDIIAEAQQEDGYLYVPHITGSSKDTDHFGVNGLNGPVPGMGDKPYSFLLHSHELYNVGIMYEGAVAYYQATGKDKWLKVAEKSAEHINRVFFEGDPNYNDGKPVLTPPGHEAIEMGLAKLYRLTGKQLYLDMAKKFIDIRGREKVPTGEGHLGAKYAQQQAPMAEQKKAEGHAVRATYLYSGAADVSALAGTDEYMEALDNIWHDMVDTKMPITGGLGAMFSNERALVLRMNYPTRKDTMRPVLL